MNEKGDCTASDPYHYEVPEPSIEILTPRGFKVSIPGIYRTPFLLR